MESSGSPNLTGTPTGAASAATPASGGVWLVVVPAWDGAHLVQVFSQATPDTILLGRLAGFLSSGEVTVRLTQLLDSAEKCGVMS